MVVADLAQRSLPERGAGDRAVAERELHGLEELGVNQRRDLLLHASGQQARRGVGLERGHDPGARGVKSNFPAFSSRRFRTTASTATPGT